MVRNGFIKRQVQNGFLSGVPGCLEHTFVAWEMLREAFENTRQLVISWLDLENAYGSVSHNLIQFALEYYGVPEAWREIIFNYYEKLMTKVITKEWSTGFFCFEIGLFQGCVLSCILFNCVFQLLLDFVEVEKHRGYQFKLTKEVQRLDFAFADDLTLTTSSVSDNQRACDRVQKWLDWSDCMKAKPSKCVSFGMKQFSDRIKFEKFKPVRPDLSYSAFDPELSINGQRMQFLLGKNNDGSYATDDFKKSHFKMLGRYISFEVNEKGVKAKIRSDVISDLDKLDGTLVDGPKKLWMYQHYAIARVSWPFLVYDLDLSFAQELTKRATSKLKWAGLASSSEVGVLYRAKKDFGLGITSLEDHYKRMQLVKCDLLKNSGSDDVRLLFQAKANKEGKEGRMWRASRLHTEREIEGSSSRVDPPGLA